MKVQFRWFYHAGRWLTRFLFFILTDCRIRGVENIPQSGPFLVVSNHLNNADPPLVAISIHRKIVFMAKEELFSSRFFGYFVRAFGAFPIHRGRIDREAIRYSKYVLDCGYGLAMFPEGMRSISGCMISALPGSALIAIKNDVPILPVGITGTEIMCGFNWIFKRPRIVVTIGQPFTLPKNSKVNKQQLNALSDFIMYRIADLLPEKYQGYYCSSKRMAAMIQKRNVK
jgi:1-acyl-sn-glycerol-3-phosphate acyltransferase